jgi:ATP/maltotriose-dependent transcriptional regulator MalT
VSPARLAHGLADALRRVLTGFASGDAAPQILDADLELGAEAFSHLLEDELTDGLVLVLDDVHELGKRGPSARFIAALCRLAPAELHLVLVSHAEPPFPIERLRAQGAVLSIDAGMLAFTEDEVGAVLAAELDMGAASSPRNCTSAPVA